ncbi:hypothetical protein BJX76DRAFT_2628 [Aspergillus varians]
MNAPSSVSLLFFFLVVSCRYSKAEAIQAHFNHAWDHARQIRDRDSKIRKPSDTGPPQWGPCQSPALLRRELGQKQATKRSVLNSHGNHRQPDGNRLR